MQRSADCLSNTLEFPKAHANAARCLLRQTGEVACSHSHTHPHCNILTLSHNPTFSHSPTSSHSHTLTHSHILTLSRILTFSHSATFSHSRTLPHSHILALSHILTIAHSVCFDKVHRADEIPSTFLRLGACFDKSGCGPPLRPYRDARLSLFPANAV